MGNLDWMLHPDGRLKAETPGGLVYAIEQLDSGFRLSTEENGRSPSSGQHSVIGFYSNIQRAQEAALAHAHAHQLL